MWNHFSHHLRNKKKMIIVYPDGIASFVLTYDDIGKCSVDGNIMLPAFLFPNLEFRIIRNLVMKSRPDDLFAITIVMTFEIGIRDVYED